MSPSKKKPKKATAPAVKDSTEPQEQALFARVVDIIDASRQHVARTVNTAMVHAYWLIGHDIVEVEQHGKARAGYGDELDRRARQAPDVAKSARVWSPYPAPDSPVLPHVPRGFGLHWPSLGEPGDSGQHSLSKSERRQDSVTPAVQIGRPARGISPDPQLDPLPRPPPRHATPSLAPSTRLRPHERAGRAASSNGRSPRCSSSGSPRAATRTRSLDLADAATQLARTDPTS